MSKKFRKLLFFSFVILFLVITPLIWLYASGFKLDSSFRLQKTGMLVIETKPKNAKIYINDKIKKNFIQRIVSPKVSLITTPAKIKSLLPGVYDIRLEKDNYWIWEKKTTIQPGQTTFIKGVRLFKKNIPQLLTNNSNTILSYSPNGKYLLLLNNTGIDIWNIKGEEKLFSLASTTFNDIATSSPPATLWSPDSKRVLVNNTIITLGDWNDTMDVRKFIGKNIRNLKWDQYDSNRIYYQLNNNLNYYQLNWDNSSTILSQSNILDYLPKNNHLYFLHDEALSLIFEVRRVDNNELLVKLDLPKSKYQFVNPESNLINLYDHIHEILYIIDPFNNYQPLRETISNVTQSQWINNNLLLYANEFEIWTLELDSSKKNLITRISTPIKDIIWHPNNRYIIYSTDKKINILELDPDGKYLTIKIVELNSIEQIHLNDEGDMLYFYSTIGNQGGVYKLAI